MKSGDGNEMIPYVGLAHSSYVYQLLAAAEIAAALLVAPAVAGAAPVVAGAAPVVAGAAVLLQPNELQEGRVQIVHL